MQEISTIGPKQPHRRLPAGRCASLCAALTVCLFPRFGHPQIILDGSLGRSGPVAGPHHLIGADAGEVRGNNLFHSFNQFNVQTGESVTFSGPGTITNVIGRVTGGLPSTIDGVVDSRTAMPSANLFLLNPSGVMIGPNASLNVGGSFHASTASYVRFADGSQYIADLAKQSTLTVAEPIAFGFLDSGVAGRISIDGGRLAVAPGKALSFVGHEVQITGASLAAPGGRIQIDGRGTGEVPLPTSLGPSAGSIDIIGPPAGASGSLTGTVLVRGGRLIVNGPPAPAGATEAGPAKFAASVSSSTGSAQVQALDDSDPAGDLVLRVDHLNLTGGAQLELSGRGLDLVATGAIDISDGAGISSQTGDLDGGAISIVSPRITIINGFISAGTTGSGNAANVMLDVGKLELLNGGQIITSTIYSAPADAGGTPRAGAGGTIAVTATESIAISGTSPDERSFLPEPFGDGFAHYESGIFSLAYSEIADITGGNAGAIALDSPTMTLSLGGKLSSMTLSPAHAGGIGVVSDSIDIMSGAQVSSLTSVATGKGGDVSLRANRVSIVGAALRTEVSGDGAGGEILIEAADLTLESATIVTQHSAPGIDPDLGVPPNDGGDVKIRGLPGASMSLNGSSIRSLTEVSGQGGDIDIDVATLLVAGGSSLGTTTQSAGPAGNLTVYVSGEARITDQHSVVSTESFGAGRAGDVAIDAGTLLLTGQALVRAGLSAGTSAGRLDVSARGSITISDGAGMSSQAFDEDVGAIEVWAPSLSIDNGFISSATRGTKDAGPVSIHVGKLDLVNGGQIASSSILTATGNAGNISITATGPINVSGRSPTGVSPIPVPFTPAGGDGSSGVFSATSSLNKKAGSGGEIRIKGGSLTLSDGGKLSVATSGPGAAGTIVLDVDALSISGRAGITSGASDSGPGGNITIRSPSIALTNGGGISASSTGTDTALAGNIDITFGDTLAINGGSITTASQSAPGGNINIVSTGSTLQVLNGLITTSVQSGAGGGGNIAIGTSAHPIGLVLFSGSQILANAFGGPGGNITMFADTYLSSGSVVDASSARNTPGTVNVSARITDLSGSVTQLPSDALQAENLLRSQCQARAAEGKLSSLVVSGREGIPSEPGGLLSSPLEGIAFDAALAPRADRGWAYQSLAAAWPASSCAR